MFFFNEISWLIRLSALKKIKLVVFEVDGVLTDGKLPIDNHGNTTKSFNVKDGVAIKLLQNEGIKTAFLSGGSKGSTNHRAESLNVDFCIVGVKNKMEALKNLQKQLGFSINQTAYLGDDLNDLPVFNYVKLFVTPFDAVTDLKKKAHVTLKKGGGEGATREFVERLLKAKGLWKKYAKYGYSELN